MQLTTFPSQNHIVISSSTGPPHNGQLSLSLSLSRPLGDAGDEIINEFPRSRPESAFKIRELTGKNKDLTDA